MHVSNRLFWEWVEKNFPSYFNDNILEFGSYDINGTIKDCFKNYKTYVGIDWRSGPCVDVVGLAHEVKFDYKAKAVLSASMLEHDPHWEDSLDNMINHLDPNGIFVLTWGSAKNPPHCLKEAPDGDFHSLPAKKVINHLEKQGFTIPISIYDAELKNILTKEDTEKIHFVSPNVDGYGEFNLVAFKNLTTDITVPKFNSVLMKEDEIN